MIRRRAALSIRLGDQAATSVALRIFRLPALQRARHVACYSSVRGEVDCGRIIREARRRGQQVYLPVLRGKRLVFRLWSPGTPMRRNRFGIAEPAGRSRMAHAAELDVIIMPLVAFDAQGRRLGMGGGYYDRTLSFLRWRGDWRNPALIGLAHDFQHIEALVQRPWDVALSAVVTPDKVFRFRR